MTQIEVLYDGSRLRSDPSFGDNVIGSEPRGTILSVREAGDWWQLVDRRAFIHTSVVRLWTPPLPPQPLDYTPYYSQWWNDAPLPQDCGPTCCKMVLARYGIQVKVSDLKHHGPTGLTSPEDLVANLADFGLKSAVQWFEAKDAIAQDTIQLIWYGGLERASVLDRGFTGLHWWVYQGEAIYGSQRFRIVHDPDYWEPYARWGEYHHYREAEYQRVWIPCGGYDHRVGVVIVG